MGFIGNDAAELERKQLGDTLWGARGWAPRINRGKRMDARSVIIIGSLAIGCVFGLPMVLGAIAIITGHMRQSRVDEANAALKRDMIDRGYTADEIIRVIDAGSGEAEKKPAKASRCG